jgi:hypothetical protein
VHLSNAPGCGDNWNITLSGDPSQEGSPSVSFSLNVKIVESGTNLLTFLEKIAMALIHYQKGDIFESNAHVIVNTVNCKGVMGKGLALAFKTWFKRK